MNKFVSTYMQYVFATLCAPPVASPHQLSRLSLKHVAESGTLAEEVISTVRTSQAFGTQSILAGLYDDHIEEARIVDYKAAMVHGVGLSCFFFVIYAAYALAFSFGTTLIRSGHGISTWIDESVCS